MMKNTNMLVLKFKNTLLHSEIRFYRQAVAQKLTHQDNLLFHNHAGIDRFRYSYPLIQYKIIDQQASIVALDQGVNAIGNFISQCDFHFDIGRHSVDMEVDSLQPAKVSIGQQPETIGYKIKSWLPFNAENYQTYLKTDSLSERIAFMEKILTGNILSFAKGLGLFIEFPLQCKLTRLSPPRTHTVKDVKLMGFDARFRCNLNIPDYLGIGKNASIGYGVVTAMDTQQKTNALESATKYTEI